MPQTLDNPKQINPNVNQSDFKREHSGDANEHDSEANVHGDGSASVQGKLAAARAALMHADKVFPPQTKPVSDDHNPSMGKAPIM